MNNKVYKKAISAFDAIKKQLIDNQETIVDNRENLKHSLLISKEHGIKKNGMCRLFTLENAKVQKLAEEFGYKAVSLEFTSAVDGGYNACAYAVANGLQCVSACIDTAGNGRFKHVRNARRRRKKFFFEQPVEFMTLLIKDLQVLQAVAQAEGLKLAVRLNTYSDIPWEVLAPYLFEMFPNVQFYDYTKELYRLDVESFPTNYFLGVSHHEKSDTDFELLHLENGGVVIAVVPVSNYSRTNRQLPKSWKGVDIQDGDEHDLLFLRQPGSLLGLKMKANLSMEKANKNTFVLSDYLEW